MENAHRDLDAPEVSQGDILSALRDMQIKNVGNMDMQNILSEVLTNNKVNDWESLLAAAPTALSAIGQCFIVAQSEGIPQIKQAKDKSIPADLRTNLVRCSDLGLETFTEAEDKMAALAVTVLAITEHRGILDKILDALDDVKSARESNSEEELRDSKEELDRQLGDLVQRAQACTENTESIVEKFKQWHSQVKKINKAFAETRGEETENLIELEKERRDLLAQLAKVRGGDDDAGMIEKLRVGLKRWIMKNEASKSPDTIHRQLNSLNTKQMDKESVIKVLGDCLDNLKQIRKSLDLLNHFFKTLHRQVEDLSENRIPAFERDILKKNMTKRRFDDIHYDAYKIRCQFMHAGNKASIYEESSQKYIMPGVKLLNGFSSATGGGANDMERKLRQLSEYYEGSLEGIRVFADRLPTHEKLMKQIEEGCLSSEK